MSIAHIRGGCLGCGLVIWEVHKDTLFYGRVIKILFTYQKIINIGTSRRNFLATVGHMGIANQMYFSSHVIRYIDKIYVYKKIRIPHIKLYVQLN